MDRSLIFGDPDDLALAKQQLEPLIRYFQSGGDGWKWLEEYRASVKSMANQLEPLLRIVRSRDYLAALRRDLANQLQFVTAAESFYRMGNCKLGAHTRDRAVEPSPPQKRILGFLGGVAHD
jgi:hypothetical protein